MTSRRQLIASLAGFSLFGVGSSAASKYIQDTDATHQSSVTAISTHTDIIGHRGFSGLYKDNSLRGFKVALDLGVDGFEIDIRLTDDGYVVLNHDPHIIDENTSRPYLIQQNTLRKLQTVDPQLMTLQTFLSKMSAYTESPDLYIGIKNSDAIKPTIRLLDQYNMKPQSVFCSFDQEDLNNIQSMFPSLDTGLIGFINTRTLHMSAENNNYDFVLPHYTPNQNPKIETRHQNRPYKYGYWILEENKPDVQEIAEVAQYLDVIMCNRPDWFIDFRSGSTSI